MTRAPTPQEIQMAKDLLAPLLSMKGPPEFSDLVNAIATALAARSMSDEAEWFRKGHESGVATARPLVVDEAEMRSFAEAEAYKVSIPREPLWHRIVEHVECGFRAGSMRLIESRLPSESDVETYCKSGMEWAREYYLDQVPASAYVNGLRAATNWFRDLILKGSAK